MTINIRIPYKYRARIIQFKKPITRSMASSAKLSKNTTSVVALNFPDFS